MMSSKIELVECDACPTSGGCVNACMKAAPAVERQPAGDTKKYCGRTQHHKFGDGYTCGENPFGDKNGERFQCKECAVPPELAELQATIATLKVLLGQARGMVNGASDEWHNAVEKVIGHE